MKEGFYSNENNIYYGCYDETQVSGRISLSIVKAENIQTNHPISENDWAVRFQDNHRLLEPEQQNLQTTLLKMRKFLPLNAEQTIGFSPIDFSPIEKKLDISMPIELKLIYTAIQNHTQYFTGKEHFLPLDKLYTEQNILVFFKQKRTPIAGYDIKSSCLAKYYKKEWEANPGDMCCYQFCVSRILTIALENKPFSRKGRCKGKFVTTLDIEKELENYCNERYHLLSGLHVYGIAVLYSEEGLIAWIRSNGFYADIHAGADDEAQLDALGSHLGDIAACLIETPQSTISTPPACRPPSK